MKDFAKLYYLFTLLQKKTHWMMYRNFNREFDPRTNMWKKNSSTNPYRGVKLKDRGPKSLEKRHFGTFSPLKPFKY